MPRPVIPEFRAGDCLSICHAVGEFGAAIVLQHGVAVSALPGLELTRKDKHLIGVLDYLSSIKPSIEVFAKRPWLVLTHHNFRDQIAIDWYSPIQFSEVQTRIEVVGQIQVSDSDPKTGRGIRSWAEFGEQVILQREWDRHRN